ncbi:glycosyltransferase family 2 protein [Christiangramia portivictoriae]|uniref:glycosyltransferase family 2 protein n=1 Tax=Christiangramia portivictoriae TaxID=326069 RepID=UPI0003FFBAB4|nr:glycosyltransferase family 2 protein [Christiangramia portivictoriae]
MKTALLVSTYNWPEALSLVFLSLENQSVFPDEVLIADDGSTEETTKLIADFKAKTKLDIHHFWHEDKGFRRSEALNKTIAGSTSDYIIQIDGDCIMHRDFIKDHLAIAEKNVFLFGSRVTITKDFKPKVFSNKIIDFNFLSAGIKKRGRTIRIPYLRNRNVKSPDFSNKVRGCNLSFWREDFIKVNGYNEDISGWGREDSELVLRMLNAGIQGKRLKYGGIIYHIYHPEASKDQLGSNNEIQQATISQKKQSCENGVSKYLTSSE